MEFRNENGSHLFAIQLETTRYNASQEVQAGAASTLRLNVDQLSLHAFAIYSIQ